MPSSYADIILPLSVRGRFTYVIPAELEGKISRGMMVRVEFGRRNIYNGIVCNVHEDPPVSGNVKPVISIPGQVLPVNDRQLKLWSWIAGYYMCHEGDVMKAALPSENSLNEYKPRIEPHLILSREYSEKELSAILDNLKKAPRQSDLLCSYIRLSGYFDGSPVVPVKKSVVLNDSGTSPSACDALVTKGILLNVDIPVSRIATGNGITEKPMVLSDTQQTAIESLKNQLQEKEIALLHGVTSSGKTEIYIHLIREQLDLGRQVLYLLPEIALTTQIIQRLKKHFGEQTGIYHSKIADAEKIEIWRKTALEDPLTGYRLILGVRSSVFLPFSNLGLVIIDEEHDHSYKQQEPAPRYHARDTAIMLAKLHKASTVLGSASPSVESYYNALSGKYGLTGLKERFGRVNLPDIIIGNTREAYRKKLMVSHFTPELLHTMDNALGKGEQIILFQNRRGFSPYVECSECGWIPVCIQCSVHLTYHKAMNRLVCHYCGYTESLPHNCGNCNSTGIVTKGFGTEKIEDEIKLVFPSARVARMDQDTTRRKHSFSSIITAFEERRIDILIGTQMISKGLDFENLTVVGILNADNLMHYPDFRSHERSFQLMEQVSGRAGRRQKTGKVVIQTSDSADRIIRLVLRHDYEGMYRMQAEERKTFNYPPFCRMVKIIIKHRDRSQLNYFSSRLGDDLRAVFGERVLGPEAPIISQVQSWYIKNILLKIEREKSSARAKELISEAIMKLEREKGASTLRIAVDVDPY